MRSIAPFILKDLERKMVFLSGPRQAGKTTLAQSLQSNFKRALYFNYDDDWSKKSLLNRTWSDENELLIFDEIHKFPRWKNWLKGIYDMQKSQHKFLVTGSARLEVYRRGGDSLLGRYLSWRLHPFSLSELPKGIDVREGFRRLMTVGSFPEPFLSQDETFASRWRSQRFNQIIKQDIRDLESISKIETLSEFVDTLRHRVGTEIVLENIAHDLEVAPKTLKQWLAALERMYLIFVVRPYSKKLPRAIKKAPKVYFYDTGDVIGDEGARYENLVAAALLKHLNFKEDAFGHRTELLYYRDKDGHEVDFVIRQDHKITALVEAKLSDTQISKSLRYLAEKLKPDLALQLISKSQPIETRNKLRLASALDILSRPEAHLLSF